MSGAPPAQSFTFNKNPSSSNRIRTQDSSTCTDSPSILPNSSDKNARGVRTSCPSVPPHLDFLQPVLFRSGSSAQHTAARPLRTSGNRVPPRVLVPNGRVLPLRRIFLPVHKSFLYPQTLLR